jgi:amino acid adenylation domain-containing protein
MDGGSDQLSSLSPSQKRERLAELLRQRGQQQSRQFQLSFTQQRLWLLNEMEGGDTIAYNIPIGLRLQGKLDVAILERAFGEVARRHDALRTTFHMNPQSGAPEQLIHSWQPFHLPVAEVSGNHEAEQEQHLRRLASQESQRPFNLRTGPLFRALLLRRAADQHILVITMHHIVSDGWSVGLIINELATLYEAYSQGQPSPLPDLPIQYVDFAHWQREGMTSEVLEQQLGYWRQQLKGPVPVLELPTRGPRPSTYSTRGAVRVWRMARDLSDGAKALSQREGVTLFMTLIAAFKVLLHRYTGEADLLVGTPIAGRNRREVEGLIGVFINTLVLRTDLSGEPTFRELLARVKEVALGAYANQDVPFEKLVEELQPERDMSRSPLFQVMFVLQNAPMPAFKKGDLVMSPLVIEGVTSKFDMTLSLMEEEDGIILGWLECNTDLFDEPMMQRLIGHYETLLRGVIADPGERLSRLPLLTEAERRQLLVEWNDTAGDYALDHCMHELFEAQVKRTPQATAVIFEGRQLTYEELNQRANKLARYLQASGIGPEILAGISMERSLEMIVALLGVLKAGAAYVPLDPTYPRERLAFMMEDADVKLVLTQSHLVQQLPDYGAPVICLDTDEDALTQSQGGRPEDSHDLQTGVSPQNLAYVIYTSGSTGKPKGVMTSHQAMCNMILWMQSAYGMTTSDRLLQKTSFSFDASVWEFFWPLISGATLVVAKPYGDKDAAYMVKTTAEENVTILQMVPSVLQMVVEQEGLENCRSLRHLFSGGEALSGAVCEKFFGRLAEARLTNVYGPTETAMHVTIWDCERGSSLRMIPIGRPVGNTQTCVLDERMQPVPIGVAGELYIGGVQVARGYVNRADLTAARFVPNPYSREPGERLYRTGDRARYRTDGGMEFLGRIDDQVKIRGYRIELGEIENVLRQHPGVLDVIVMAREDVPGDKRLAAYVVPGAAQELKISELRNHLMAKLPDYMIPSGFMLLEELPLMSNGKVDRHALPSLEHTRQELEQDYVAPRNDVEEKLAAIFSEVLNVEEVGVEDNFFLLGGHSLSATQVMTRILGVLQADIPLRRIFETPTVAGLAQAVEQFQSSSEEDRIEVISRPGPEEAEPLETLLGQLSGEELQALLLEVAARKTK